MVAVPGVLHDAHLHAPATKQSQQKHLPHTHVMRAESLGCSWRRLQVGHSTHFRYQDLEGAGLGTAGEGAHSCAPWETPGATCPLHSAQVRVRPQSGYGQTIIRGLRVLRWLRVRFGW